MALHATPDRHTDIPEARVGYAWVRHLSLSVALKIRPELAGKPVIVSSEGSNGGVVLDASEECLAAGVGRPMREAREYRPDAAILPADTERERRAHEELLDAIEVISPAVEDDGVGRAYFALDRPVGKEDGRWMLAWLRKLVEERLGFEVHLALAPDKFTARIAAERDPDATTGTLVLLSGEAEEYLSPLPVEVLPLPPRALERLRLLGIATVGGFGRLPRDGIARRFGREAIAAHELARGMDSRPVAGRAIPEVRTARQVFESPVETLTPLITASESLLERLCSELRAEGKAFRKLGLTLEGETGEVVERTAQLRAPTVEPGPCLAALRALPETAAINSPVTAISLRLSAIGPMCPEQGALFVYADSREERKGRLEGATREIGRRYPARLRRVSPSDVPTLLDEHRFGLLPYETDDTQPAPRESPHSAQRFVSVERRGERPYLVEGDRPDELVAICGCWRAEEWWPEEIERAYWRVRTRSGRVLTLARDSTGFRLVEVMD